MPPNDSLGPLILGIVSTFNGLDIIIVALRFYDRAVLRGGVGWDDWTILMACAVTTFGSVCNVIMVANNWGRHIEYLSEQQLSTALEWTTFAELQSYIAVYLVKLSVCLFILRLLRSTHPKMRWTVVGTIAVLTITTIVVVVLLCVSCIPLSGLWNLDPSTPKKCLSKDTQTSVTRAFGVIGILTDFLCVVIPIAVVQGLQMNPRQKIAVSVIIALGLL